MNKPDCIFMSVYTYFLVSTNENLQRFEQQRSLLLNKHFNEEVLNLLQMLDNLFDHKVMDHDYLKWLTKTDIISFESQLETMKNVLSYSIANKTMRYSHQIICSLFYLENFNVKHSKYSFISHGYPVVFDLSGKSFPEYVIFKRGQEICKSVIVKDVDIISEVFNHLQSSDCLYLNQLHELMSSRNVLILQSQHLMYSNNGITT